MPESSAPREGEGGCCCCAAAQKGRKISLWMTVFVAVLLLGIVLFSDPREQTPSLQQFQQIRSSLKTQEMGITRAKDGSVVILKLEIASTPEQQEIGLMYRDKVPSGTGMLFVFSPPSPASFWMKNTSVPLDILFIDETNRIIRIVQKTTPQDLTKIGSDGPVKGVIEIGAGETERLKIALGDTLNGF